MRRPRLKALPPPPERQSRPTVDMTSRSGQPPPAARHVDSSDEEGGTRETGGATVGMYKMYAEKGEERKTAGASLLDRVVSKQKIIGANGGASSPSMPIDPRQQLLTAHKRPGEGETSGPFSRLPVRERPTQERTAVKQDNPFAASGQRIPSIYEGSQQTTNEQPKRPMPRTNPISELNSMPGQRHISGETRPARPLDDDETPSIWSKFVSIVPPLPRLPSFSRLLGRGSDSYRMYAEASMEQWRIEEEESKRRRKRRDGAFSDGIRNRCLL